MSVNIHDRTSWERFVRFHVEGPDEWPEDYVEAIENLRRRCHERGDTLVAYQNQELGHPDLGQFQFVSFGSAAAQLERAQFGETPPRFMPDIGSAINWRYCLSEIVPPFEEE